MKRPSMQFYPGDWRSNAKLRRCSPAARGVWMDVMCLLHDSDEYGLVRWPLAEIALAAGAAIAHVRELASKGVLKGNDTRLEEAFIYTPRSGRKDGEPVTLIPTQAGPIWYSSRMVKDEYVRTIRGQSSRFGDGESAAPKRSPKPPKGDGSSSSSSPSGYTPYSPPVGGGSPDGDPTDLDLLGSAPAETLRHKRDDGPARGTRVPDGDLPEDWATAANRTREEHGMPLLNRRVLGLRWAAFQDYWRGVAGSRGRKVDWLATWRNDCRSPRTEKNFPPDAAVAARAPKFDTTG